MMSCIVLSTTFIVYLLAIKKWSGNILTPLFDVEYGMIFNEGNHKSIMSCYTFWEVIRCNIRRSSGECSSKCNNTMGAKLNRQSFVYRCIFDSIGAIYEHPVQPININMLPRDVFICEFLVKAVTISCKQAFIFNNYGEKNYR